MADDKTEVLPPKSDDDFEHCEKHDFRYPKGGECPKCKEEKGG